MPFEIQELFLILSSTFITAAVFNLALFFGYHKKPDYLFFACYCAFHVFKVWLKTFPEDQVLITSLMLTAFDLVYISVIFGLFSLNIFLLHHYEIRQKKPFIVGGAVFSLTAFFTLSEGAFIYLGIAIALSQSISGFRKRPGDWSYLIGLLSLLMLTLLGAMGVLPFGYFVGTILMILFMVISSGVALARQTRQLSEATLKSARLENQLLKKSIQPHFVLNALTSLQELIERHPQLASGFVQDLSRVFSVFARVSDRQLISLKEELELVRSFLKVMAVRMDKQFEMVVQDLDGKEMIPPGVLLTLVENGVTHGFEQQSEGRFVLSKSMTPESTVLTIENNGIPPEEIREGVGLHYVRSRLEEAFGNRFSLEFEQMSHGFMAKITIGV